MKKLLLCALWLLVAVLPFHAFAEDVPDFPFIEDPFGDRSDDSFESQDPIAGQNAQMVIDGKAHTLGFDPTPEYSSAKDGMIQASFYEYDSGSNTLYELYLIFPETVESGSTVTPDSSIESGRESSVVMIVSDNDTETYYVSGVTEKRLYPEGSVFSMEFDFVTGNEGSTDYVGAFSATLVALDLNTGEVIGTMDISSGLFNFSLDGVSSQRHDEPLPTAVPGDLRKA